MSDMEKSIPNRFPAHCVCAFCKGGTESVLEQILGAELNCVAFTPKVEREESHGGKKTVTVRKMMPGYIFIFSDDSISASELYRIDGILRLLKYDDGEYDLREDDLRFAKWLYSNDGKIGLSTAISEGTKIRVINGPLLDYAGSIIEVKRGKRIAKVRIAIGDTIRDIWIGFELMEPESMINE